MYTNQNQKITNSRLIRIVDSLGLGSNRLTRLPESIGALRALVSVDFNGNQLTEIPDSVSGWNSLLYAFVSGNQLQTLPDSMAEIATLSEIHIEDNPMTADEIQRLQSLFGGKLIL